MHFRNVLYYYYTHFTITVHRACQGLGNAAKKPVKSASPKRFSKLQQWMPANVPRNYCVTTGILVTVS